MDPTQCLKEIREEIKNFWEMAESNPLESTIEKIEALDQWLTRGGFLPEQWEENRKG